MKTTVRKFAIGFAGLAAGLILIGAGCEKTVEPFRDAPRGAVNDKAADFLTFPDGFSNVATKCDGPNRVYVIFKGDEPRGSIAVAANDARCTGRAG